MLGSQHNGTYLHPYILRSLSGCKVSQQGGRECHETPNGLHPLYLPIHPFLVVLKNDRWSAYYYTSFTLRLIPEYPKGWWLGRGGRARQDINFKLRIETYSNFIQALIRFFNQLTIWFNSDLHKMQWNKQRMKWNKHRLMERGGWATLTVPITLKIWIWEIDRSFSGEMWRGGCQIFPKSGEGVA